MKYFKNFKNFIPEGLEAVLFKGKEYSIYDGFAFLKIWGDIYFANTHNDCLINAFLDKQNYKKLGYFRKPDLRPMMNTDELDNLILKMNPLYTLRGRFFKIINLIVIPKWELEETNFIKDLKELKNDLEIRFRSNTNNTILEIDNSTSEIGYRFLLNDFIENYKTNFSLRKYNVGEEINEIY